MKKSFCLICLLLSLGVVLCSCGETTVTSEISFEEENSDDYEDFDASSKSDKTSSKKKKTSSKKSTSSKKETSSKKTTSSKTEKVSSEESGKTFNYADYYTMGKSGSNKVIVYNAIKGYTNCKEYKVEVNAGDKWIPVPVYYAEVARNKITTSAKTYFASVDLTGSIKVKVTPSEKFSKCEVKPKADVPSAKTSGNTVEFTVNGAMQLSLEFDGNVMNNLQFFANPVETNIPDINDPNVIFLTPGVHDINNCPYIRKAYGGVDTLALTSGQTLYLAGGAVLKASIVVDGSKNVTICGRGIVDLLYYNVPSGKKADALDANAITSYPSGLKLINTNNVKIEGITFRNSLYYTIYGGCANKTTIDNVKLIARCEYSDGFDFMASSNVNIKNCYIRSNDDGIAIYATRWDHMGNSAHWTVDNCVFLTDCAHSVNIGSHGVEDGGRDEIFDLKFTNLDILDCYETGSGYWGALGFTVSDNNYVHDVTFDTVRMYKLASSRPVAVYTKKFGSDKVAGYRVENVLFKNITLYGEAADYKKAQLKGNAESRIVTGITFENYVVGGTKVTEANKDAYFDIQKNVTNVTIK